MASMSNFDQEERQFLQETFLADDDVYSLSDLDDEDELELQELFPSLDNFLRSDEVMKCYDGFSAPAPSKSVGDTFPWVNKYDLGLNNIDSCDTKHVSRDQSPTSIFFFDVPPAPVRRIPTKKPLLPPMEMDTRVQVVASSCAELKEDKTSAPSKVSLKAPPKRLPPRITSTKTKRVAPPKRKRGRPKRDPKENWPKRPLSAYNLFFKSERLRLIALKDEIIKDTNTKAGNISFESLAKRVAQKWKVLSDEERKPFEEEAAQEKVEYKKKLEEFHSNIKAEAEKH